MKLTYVVGAIAATAVVFAPMAVIADHCSNYRGPAGQVPPAGRTPQDPTPAPTPGGGTTPGGGALPGLTPGAGPTAAPGPGGLPTARPAGGGATAAGPRGGTTPGGRRKAAGVEGFERWEFWWEHNKDAYLNLKQNLSELVFTSSADYFLGKGEAKNVSDVVEPTQQVIDTELTPALTKVLDDRFYLVRDAAVLAVAKVGGAGSLEAITAKLSDDNRYVKESAVISLGILGDTAAVPTLLSILRADKNAMKLFNSRKVRPELRAFAAVALGLLGDESAIPDLTKVCKTDEARKDAAVASALALGLMGSEAASEQLIDLVQRPGVHELVRAHAATSIGKLGGEKAIPVMIRALRDKSVHVSRSAVIALGLLGDESNHEVLASLTQIARKGDDIQSRNWACIALGQIGGDVARKTLLGVLQGQRRSLQAFAALGLGIMLQDNPDATTVKHLRIALAKAKEQSVRGAFAISLGLARDAASAKSLVEIVRSNAGADVRGYAAVALGLMKAKQTSPAIQRTLAESQKRPELARSLAITLGLMGDRDAVPVLSKVLAEAKTDEVRSSAALALGQIGDITAVAPLVSQLFQNPGAPERTRAFAATALGIIGEDAALPVMSRLSRNSNYRAMVPAIQVLMSLL